MKFDEVVELFRGLCLQRRRAIDLLPAAEGLEDLVHDDVLDAGRGLGGLALRRAHGVFLGIWLRRVPRSTPDILDMQGFCHKVAPTRLHGIYGEPILVKTNLH